MWAIKRIFAGAAAMLLIGSCAFAAPRYSTKEAAVDEFEKTSTFNCQVIYRSTQSVAVYNGGATMGEMLIEAGAAVEAGDVVATYYAPMSDLDITRTELALAQAIDDHEFELDQRNQIIEEYRLAAENASDPADARINELLAQKEELMLDKYVAGAEANIAALTAQRDAALASDQPKDVTAGLSGLVADTARIDAGMAINGKQLVGIFDPTSLLIRVDNSAGTLKYGMKVTLNLEGANKKSVSATVVSADNVLPGALHSGAAYVLPDETITDAGYNRASLYTQTLSVKDVVIVDNDAIQYSNSKPYVRILTADGVVHTRYVKIAMIGDNKSWVIRGVEPGDKLITK